MSALILAFVLLFCWWTPAYAEAHFCVTAKPRGPVYNHLTVGNQKLIAWALVITRSEGAIKTADIFARIPLSAWTEKEARKLLPKQAQNTFGGALADYSVALKTVGPAGMTFAGTRVNNDAGKTLLFAAAGLWAIAQSRAERHAPEPNPTLEQYLPDAGAPGDGVYLVIVEHLEGADVELGPMCRARSAEQ